MIRFYSPEFLEFLKVVTTEQVVIIDTETTGLVRGEIVQIAICDLQQNGILHTYIKPRNPIPNDATRIHGITDDMVEDAPTWALIRPAVIDAITGKHVVIYNATYDRKMMHQSDEVWGLPHFDYKAIAPFHCAMLAYAEYWDEWNEYRQSFRWQKLSDAAREQNIRVDNAHDAMGDCLMTVGIINAMVKDAPYNVRHPQRLDYQDFGLST